jgi:hypothetical protein
MTPNERNLDALYDTIESEVRRLETLQAKTYIHQPAKFTTSDKLQIRKLRLKK